jgi:hypothetical protein
MGWAARWHADTGAGRLGVTGNPAGAPAAWWCEAMKAGPVIRAARRHSGDIPAAARALGIALTDHATALARAQAARPARRRKLENIRGHRTSATGETSSREDVRRLNTMVAQDSPCRRWLEVAENHRIS